MDYDFIDIQGERFICVNKTEDIPTFFVSMISSNDHWFFIATNGSLSAGRKSPETSLFPYYTVDKIINNANFTGPHTSIKVGDKIWEPFKETSSRLFSINRKIYKSINGDSLIFEEHNNDLSIKFSYRWNTSDTYGFIRTSNFENLSNQSLDVFLLDGVNDFLASGVDDKTHQFYSCLTDAYKISELDSSNHLLIHRMAASLTDEAIPLECLKATIVWSYGWDESSIIIDNKQAEDLLYNSNITLNDYVRGKRGSYYKAGRLTLKEKSSKSWSIILDIDKSQNEVADLILLLKDKNKLKELVENDIKKGKDKLDYLIASSDGVQLCSDEIISVYHRANVLFNIMRGGVFKDNYFIEKNSIIKYVKIHLKKLSSNDLEILELLPLKFKHYELGDLLSSASNNLTRVCFEYLPLVFSRRHGDPSRPWNQFSIKTKDNQGNEMVGFQGNWRDIFQNWEALALSFPKFNDTFIYKFLNASTADGYNPYRITSEGIEWELEDPNDPWSSIGYWGDHQIIYLLKLLEFSFKINQDALLKLLNKDIFVFANVPYELKSFNELQKDPNHTINFNQDKHKKIEELVKHIGSDGKLVYKDNEIINANLLEKLLIPLLVKLGNFVPDGGIWMNTQRPEWNDANNALAGNGLSMVTTCYIYRYLTFLEELIKDDLDFRIYRTIKEFFDSISKVFEKNEKDLSKDNKIRYKVIEELGYASERYRKKVYNLDYGDKVDIKLNALKKFIFNSKKHVKATIINNKRKDGLYNSYNILNFDLDNKIAKIDILEEMLEGQVAILSSKAIDGKEALNLYYSLKKSPLYCKIRNTYILYPDKKLPNFLDYNKFKKDDFESIKLLSIMTEFKDNRIIEPGIDGLFRFNANIRNKYELDELLSIISKEEKYTSLIKADNERIVLLYEKIFNHKKFTGRSGSMFAYEGLGSVYWHMVSKLMLAIQEVAFDNKSSDVFNDITNAYYEIQNGLGFRKSVSEYGAFTADAYSHTPSFSGAQQPGLTGMVKEGIVCRFNELGIEFIDSKINFRPSIFRRNQLVNKDKEIEVRLKNNLLYKLTIPINSVFFTLFQVPVVYVLCVSSEPKLEIEMINSEKLTINGDQLNEELTDLLLSRDSKIVALRVYQPEYRFI